MHERQGHLRICPHCAQPLRPMRYGVSFGPLAAQIIDTIQQAGGDGVRFADLFDATYGRDSDASRERLRSYISAINRALATSGVSIRGDRRVYRIERRRA